MERNPLIRENPGSVQQFGLRMVLGKIVIYTALLIAGLLAVPACICTLLMDGTQNMANRILKRLDF